MIEAILLNSHLKEVDEESWRGLSEHGSCEIRKIAAQSRFATEERLKEMLKYEVKAGRDLEVIEAILLNSHLKEIDEGSWKDLSKHESWRIREIAAQSRFATEERLEEMIKREVKVGKDLDVINAIISNLNFKNDEETSS